MRPYHDHAHHGGEAHADGRPMDPPYPADEVRGAQWIVGWRAADLERVVEDEGFGAATEDDVMMADADLSYARDALDRALRTVRHALPSLAEVEAAVIDAVGPVGTWPTRCYAVADALFRSGLIRDSGLGPHWRAHGAWDGPVAPGSPFAARGVAQHGWIEFERGFVVDPTRWVFEDVDPYLAVAPIGEYDLGKTRLVDRSRMRRPRTGPGEGRPLDVDPDGVLAQVLGRLVGPGPWTDAHLREVTTGPAEDVGPDLPAFVDEVVGMGLGAYVPADIRVMVEDRATTDAPSAAAPSP